ncbi:hypothetical protein SCHPADRAFT_530209 [Schizopora paradoxa]|uniref:DUF6533 domain-containing protein n=1 Tax=Schizopora paradoxa TaxID=27342 RepID=A0A0H2RZJ7_9AGAM|nr:hypothetical protein SCHPADRAFT_530209 [Schizopora paradoxa]
MNTSIPTSDLGPILSEAGVQIVSSKYAIIGCFTIFIYDYFLTLDDEIKYIWKRPFSLVTFCYFINRYYAMCEFTLQVRTSLWHSMRRCKRYVPLQPFGEGIPFTIFPDLVIGLRVYALYGRNRFIGAALATYLAAELGVALWLYLVPSIHPVPLPGPSSVDQIPELHLCLAAASTNLSNLQSATFQFMQTIFDSIAFILIISKTAKDAFGPRRTGNIQALIARHGLLYYVVVFSANLTWALMILISPPGLKYSAAVPTIMMACLSVNKMTISLRSFSEREEERRKIADVAGIAHRRRRRSWIGTSNFEVGDEDSSYGSESNFELTSVFEIYSHQMKSNSTSSSNSTYVS